MLALGVGIFDQHKLSEGGSRLVLQSPGSDVEDRRGPKGVVLKTEIPSVIPEIYRF